LTTDGNEKLIMKAERTTCAFVKADLKAGTTDHHSNENNNRSLTSNN